MGIFTVEPKKIKLSLFCVNSGVHIFWSVQSEKNLILKEKSTNFISEEIHCPEGKTICLVSLNTVSHPFNTRQPKWPEKYNWITSLFCLKLTMESVPQNVSTITSWCVNALRKWKVNFPLWKTNPYLEEEEGKNPTANWKASYKNRITLFLYLFCQTRVSHFWSWWGFACFRAPGLLRKRWQIIGYDLQGQGPFLGEGFILPIATISYAEDSQRFLISVFFLF